VEPGDRAPCDPAGAGHGRLASEHAGPERAARATGPGPGPAAALALDAQPGMSVVTSGGGLAAAAAAGTDAGARPPLVRAARFWTRRSLVGPLRRLLASSVWERDARRQRPTIGVLPGVLAPTADGSTDGRSRPDTASTSPSRWSGTAPVAHVVRASRARAALNEIRLEWVRIGVVETGIVLSLLAAYALLPGGVPHHRGGYFTLIGVAAAATVAVACAPWHRFAERGLVLPAMVAWSVADTAVLAGGIALSGGFRSELYLVYLTLVVFLAGVAYPRAIRLSLSALIIASYVVTLAALGWHVQGAAMVLRVGMIGAVSLAADALSAQVASELQLHLAIADVLEGRAGLWSRVAGMGRALSTMRPEAVFAWMVDSVIELDFQGASVSVLEADGTTYRVAHPVGLPAGYRSGSMHPAGTGVTGMVLEHQRTVTIDDYDQRADVLPALASAGFRSVIGTPVWVDGQIAAVLAAGTRTRRRIDPEEIAAVELLAAHAGRALEDARALERERRTASRFKSLLESAPDAVVVVGIDGTIVDANHQAARLYGYEAGELPGMPVATLVPERVRGAIELLRRDFQTKPRRMAFGEDAEVMGLRRDGTEFPVEITLAPIDTPDGLVVSMTVRDVTERREFERRLEHQATHDHLTGLPNRSLFVERLADALRQVRPGEPPLTVCFLDVDHFKYVNDSRGHAIGDDLVTQIAQRIARSADPGDLVARFGGDEFAVLARGQRARQDAVAYAWRLLSAFDRPFVLDGVECFVSASAGIAFGEGGSDVHDVLRQADAAMYHAKQSGRARVELFDEELTARAVERLDLETALHQALLHNELFLVYQPVVALSDRRIAGVEALVRWRHPERGLVPPVGFIPIAEDTGLILPIGRWVLHEACRQAAAWRSAHPALRDLSVNVNVSSRQLEHDRMIADVAAALDDSGLEPGALTLEITESFFIKDLPAALRRLDALKRLGVRLAIDDFGTGFSSLNSLSRLPIDEVKIDKSFVDGLGTRFDAVISAVVAVAGAFDLHVVAEGIEREDQVERITRLGCGYAQGYLFAKPLLPQQIPALVDDHR